MPVNYARDDVRRLVTVSMQGPFDTRSLVDTLDRQIAEGTWAYARLYDERGVTVAPTSQQIRALLDGEDVRGGDLERGRAPEASNFWAAQGQMSGLSTKPHS